MEFIHSHIPGLVEILPKILTDERGLFFESYSKKLFADNGIPVDFVQDNQSFSYKSVLRGLHFQKAPYAQGKLVRVVSGKVIDIAVDIRPDSPTFGQHQSFVLDAHLHNMIYVPEGFAHGFVTLEDAVFQYKCTNFYHKAAEGGISWNDEHLGIDWGIENPIVSTKDQILPAFKEIFP